VAVSGMHHTGMSAMHVFRVSAGTGVAMTGSGATAVTFLLPLVVGISVISFILTTTIAITPDHNEIRAQADLGERISRGGELQDARPAPPAVPQSAQPGSRISQA